MTTSYPPADRKIFWFDAQRKMYQYTKKFLPSPLVSKWFLLLLLVPGRDGNEKGHALEQPNISPAVYFREDLMTAFR